MGNKGDEDVPTTPITTEAVASAVKKIATAVAGGDPHAPTAAVDPAEQAEQIRLFMTNGGWFSGGRTCVDAMVSDRSEVHINNVFYGLKDIDGTEVLGVHISAWRHVKGDLESHYFSLVDSAEIRGFMKATRVKEIDITQLHGRRVTLYIPHDKSKAPFISLPAEEVK